jgi:hypothetical protein
VSLDCAAMNQIDADQIRIPADREDVLAVCVMPDGKKLLWVKPPGWMLVYLAVGMIGLALMGVASAKWDWSVLFLLFPGAGIAYLVILLAPRALLSDPAKPHHWFRR